MNPSARHNGAMILRSRRSRIAGKSIISRGLLTAKVKDVLKERILEYLSAR